MSGSYPAKPRIAIVGAGNLAECARRRVRGAGYGIDQSFHGEGGFSAPSAALGSRSWGVRRCGGIGQNFKPRSFGFAFPMERLPGAAASLVAAAELAGKVALHSSGALTSDELAVLRRRGAAWLRCIR